MARQSRETTQKKILKHEILRFNRFFTAEELHAKVRNIGIATVYRFLKEAEKNHELHSYLCDRKTIYSTGKMNHCHFTCQKCGTIKHLNIDSIDFMKRKIDGSICHFQIDVEGICNNCI